MSVRGLQKECHVVPRQFVQFESEQSCLGKRSKSMPTKVSAVSLLQTCFPYVKVADFYVLILPYQADFFHNDQKICWNLYAQSEVAFGEHHHDLFGADAFQMSWMNGTKK